MYRKALVMALLMALVPACGDDDADPNPTPKPDAAVSKPDQKVTPADMAPADLSPPDSASPDQTVPDASLTVVPTWVGRKCTTAEDCLEPPKSAVTDETCLSGGDWEWPGGYCSRDCDVVTAPCPAGSHCEELMATGPNPTVCIQNCYDKSQCSGPGYVCHMIPGTDYGACIPFD